MTCFDLLHLGKSSFILFWCYFFRSLFPVGSTAIKKVIFLFLLCLNIIDLFLWVTTKAFFHICKLFCSHVYVWCAYIFVHVHVCEHEFMYWIQIYMCLLHKEQLFGVRSFLPFLFCCYSLYCTLVNPTHSLSSLFSLSLFSLSLSLTPILPEGC